MRVLLVDDNEELRDFLALSLTEAAVEVVVAQDPADALKKVEGERFDGIIIDFVMDNADGIALAGQMRGLKTARNVPILLMSAISTALARRMAKDAGCTEFLVKPFGQMQFVDQVKSLR
jgi:DNA-binding response OmpR family regulator